MDKSADLNAILERKIPTILKFFDALDFKLTCKEIEVRDKCDRLDDFLDSKEFDVQDKAAKIRKLEALMQRKDAILDKISP